MSGASDRDETTAATPSGESPPLTGLSIDGVGIDGEWRKGPDSILEDVLVHRYNAYPALVEALREALEWCEEDFSAPEGSHPSRLMRHNRVRRLRAALAQAQEGA